MRGGGVWTFRLLLGRDESCRVVADIGVRWPLTKLERVMLTTSSPSQWLAAMWMSGCPLKRQRLTVSESIASCASDMGCSLSE